MYRTNISTSLRYATALLGLTSLTGCSGHVLTAQGAVEGTVDGTNRLWLGIPFADTTAGENRWRAPQPAPVYDGVLNATSYGHTCPQALQSSSLAPQGEDCLNLNIWAPQDGEGYPVFVYIYGGAMVTGGNSDPTLSGSNFASNGVVFVSLNYRESMFGSPNSPELADEVQNFSILDVQAAMDWVYGNIEAFGGNASHIVLGGHSSGSVMVDHYLWNNPDTWLVGAMEMSANAVSGPTYAPQGVGLDAIAAQVGCPTGAGQLECLREIDFLEFETSEFNSTYNTWFTPTVDDVTRFSSAGYESRYALGLFPSHVPLLVGNAAAEGAIFSRVYGSENSNFSTWIDTFDADLGHIPDDDILATYNLADYNGSNANMSGASYGDARFLCATDYLVDLRSEEQDNIWRYLWTGEVQNSPPIQNLGPTHGSEIPFFFGGGQNFAGHSWVTDEVQGLATFMHGVLVEWIKNPSQGPGWDATSPVDGTVGFFGVEDHYNEVVVDNSSCFNSKCQELYKPWFPDYPAFRNPADGGALVTGERRLEIDLGGLLEISIDV